MILLFEHRVLKCGNSEIGVSSMHGKINWIEEASDKTSYLKRQYFLQEYIYQYIR